MSWARIDPATDLREIFAFGARFHGHSGPFLALGIRMGLLALRVLGSTGHHGIRAEVETGTGPPLSCLVDGIQVSTGCTVGKGNLLVRPQGQAVAEFAAFGKTLRVEVRPAWLSRIQAAGAADSLAEEVLAAPEEELFSWSLSAS